MTETIPSTIEDYLQALSKTLPEGTYLSHQSTLRQFKDWCGPHDVTREDIDADTIADFAEQSLFGQGSRTVVGKVHTLANFYAYLSQDDPEIIKRRVMTSMETDHLLGIEDEKTTVTDTLRTSKVDNSVPTEAVEAVITYLRECRYGTRTHAFTELLIDTNSRPVVIQQVDLSDYRPELNAIQLNLPDTFAVKVAGLVDKRSAAISISTIKAVDDYITHERKSPSNQPPKPLFTTSRGRASLSTHRWRIKEASKAAAESPVVIENFDDNPLVDESRNEPRIQTITPSDLCRYSLTNY